MAEHVFLLQYMQTLGGEMYSVLSLAECVKSAHLLFFFLSCIPFIPALNFSVNQNASV